MAATMTTLPNDLQASINTTTVTNYKITTTLEDAATEIRRSSFAIYQVPRKTAQSIRQAWREAVVVLNNPPPQPIRSSSAKPIEKWTRIVQGNLFGYNEPSRAKRLFRAFPASSLQPWPNESFRQVSTTLATNLHAILLDCHSHLQQQQVNQVTEREQTSSEIAGLHGSRKKRPRLESSSSTTTPNHGTLVRVDAKDCPLDYFLYHNLDPIATNCSAHVDRGLLIAVCLTNVPGLEILRAYAPPSSDTPEGPQWVCPEVAIHNASLYNETGDSSVSDLICIMAGGQLGQSIGAKVPACVHRVRDKLKRSRLSISYELRMLAK